MIGVIFSFDPQGNSPSEFSPHGFSSRHLPTPTTLPDFLACGQKGYKNPVIQQQWRKPSSLHILSSSFFSNSCWHVLLAHSPNSSRPKHNLTSDPTAASSYLPESVKDFTPHSGGPNQKSGYYSLTYYVSDGGKPCHHQGSGSWKMGVILLYYLVGC